MKLPAITGNPDFERVFRVQMNTLEWLPIFLPSLWLFAIYISDAIAAAIGAVWVIGRIVYMIGYTKSVPGRGPGFGDPGIRHYRAVVWRDRRGGVGDRAPIRLSSRPANARGAGPIPRDLSIETKRRTPCFHDIRLWLWAPAYAGATDAISSAGSRFPWR